MSAGRTRNGAPLLSCSGVERTLGAGRRRTAALRGVGLAIGAGEAVAVVGRSGAGKSTLVGVLAALDRPDRGTVLLDGTDVWAAPERRRRELRRRVGWVPQDALSSFDPRFTAGEVVAEALPGAPRGFRGARSGGAAVAAAVAELFERVGLDPGLAPRRPVTLSGGERQRVAIARALAVRPAVLLADEATSGLDTLAARRVLDALEAATGEGRALVVVTHDLRVAHRLARRIVVMDEGRIVEDVAADTAGAVGPHLDRLRRATP
ncbi:ABC-type dipeptide/oligopeptide/nickel transport system ATPase subunit [Murinocardiopsis flavida]|uniref:ABC-type dipeptide/oligopeptide/nickel transport system ATPase subunit n=1 Tax=Murinocardiopsis flavida TaxID=645275 RepID=A0A2P8DQS3_9ACTN|nr:dipeptide/oligopeptide/nickel ABC transporter ATP-binding protein [Murinocardiopsis flavida]PSK99577.1 ABC-type dipeptide/oligopeptide/nickel transport system ATPase subunit [Murinocardiopsis flavida]